MEEEEEQQPFALLFPAQPPKFTEARMRKPIFIFFPSSVAFRKTFALLDEAGKCLKLEGGGLEKRLLRQRTLRGEAKSPKSTFRVHVSENTALSGACSRD